MSFTSETFDIEELIDMSKEIITMLEREERDDLVDLFKKMMDKCDLEYETESSVSSEDYDEDDVVGETITIKTDPKGFKSIDMA